MKEEMTGPETAEETEAERARLEEEIRAGLREASVEALRFLRGFLLAERRRGRK